MPTRQYQCDHCGHGFEDFYRLMEAHPEKCPQCETTYGEVFHQVYHGGAGFVIKGSPTTVGQQAEINARKMGGERMQMLREQQAAEYRGGFTGKLPDGATPIERPTETPWFRSGEVQGLPKMDKPLNLNKVKDVKKYVATGETK